MKFTSLLVESESSKLAKTIPSFGSYEDYGFRSFNKVELPGGVSLSIQASYAHYCKPRKTLPVEDYQAMEMAIFLNGEWSSVEEVSKNEVLISKFNGYTDGVVYGFLPVKLIQELYAELAEGDN